MSKFLLIFLLALMSDQFNSSGKAVTFDKFCDPEYIDAYVQISGYLTDNGKIYHVGKSIKLSGRVQIDNLTSSCILRVRRIEQQ